MKNQLHRIGVLAALTVAAVLPLRLAAQPESQPYVFFSDEPGGGAYLGVDTRDITPERVSTLHLKEESGVEVTMVDQDAPAGKAGLKEHDVILAINDQKIEGEEQLRRVIHEIPPGRTVSIGISRDGQPMTLKAQLAARSMDHNFNFNTPNINIPAIHIPAINMPEIDVPSVVVIHSPRSSGLMLETLTTQLSDYFGVKSGHGVLVRSVEKGSRGEQAGFKAGDVIIKINGSEVSDCSDFTRLLRKRTDNKAAVTVMRDRKEQTLTLILPEPRRSGSNPSCDYLDSETCAEILDQGSEIAQAIPEITTAEWKRLQPEMENLKKQVQSEMRKHGDQLKKDLEQLQQELGRQQQEIKRQMEGWRKEAEI